MKAFPIFLLTSLSSTLFGQSGYLKLNNDTVLVGYVKYYTSAMNGQRGLEFWRTKNDNAPRRIPKLKIQEYAIKKDTFKVLHQFKPFHESNIYFELADAKLVHRGKVSLLKIEDYKDPNRVVIYTGDLAFVVWLGSITYLYILENTETGFIKGLPSKKGKIKEALRDFFPDEYIDNYVKLKGEIKYKSIPELVRLYNSK